MKPFDWIEEFGEPGPHVPYCVVPTSFGSVAEAATDIKQKVDVRAAIAPLCESPIEIDLGAALKVYDGKIFDLIPQFNLGRFRYDFAIRSPSGKIVLLIECDGREFHQTPEQIENDRKKDDLAEANGIQLLRFTGSDIYRDAPTIAGEIADLASLLIGAAK